MKGMYLCLPKVCIQNTQRFQVKVTTTTKSPSGPQIVILSVHQVSLSTTILLCGISWQNEEKHECMYPCLNQLHTRSQSLSPKMLFLGKPTEKQNNIHCLMVIIGKNDGSFQDTQTEVKLCKTIESDRRWDEYIETMTKLESPALKWWSVARDVIL